VHAVHHAITDLGVAKLVEAACQLQCDKYRSAMVEIMLANGPPPNWRPQVTEASVSASLAAADPPECRRPRPRQGHVEAGGRRAHLSAGGRAWGGSPRAVGLETLVDGRTCIAWGRVLPWRAMRSRLAPPCSHRPLATHPLSSYDPASAGGANDPGECVGPARWRGFFNAQCE
jgi:hypothetical protein